MKTSSYDILIVGAGPIGASTAYHLRESGVKIAIIDPGQESEDPLHKATFKYAGGSVRWNFEDAEIRKATEATGKFIREKLAEGIDLAALADNYVFAHRGTAAPSFNISGAKLVKYLLSESEKSGATHEKATLLSISKEEDYLLKTTNGEMSGKKVLLALGPSLREFVPEGIFEFEKRQTFVLDLEVPPERETFPHLVLKVGKGIAYVFIKKVEGELKMLISQEEIIEENNEPRPDDYFKKLLDSGLSEMMPFLKEAKVQKILWGFDAKNKKVKIHSEDGKLYAAACGSAVRSSIGIGKELSEILLQK